LDSERKKHLLVKYLNDEYSAKELEELLSYVHSLDRDQRVDEGFEEVWNAHPSFQLLDDEKTEGLFNQILYKAGQVERDKRSFRKAIIYKVAAAFIGILVCSYLIIYLPNSNQYRTETTSYGKTREVLLPDGSTVTLNSNSIIKYKSNWSSQEQRVVELQGEAFFKVTHTAGNQKFIVEAGTLKVEVLGTEFNVMTRKSRSFVVLNKGKIKLDVSGEDDYIMKPGEMVEVNPSQSSIMKRMVNPELYSSWRNNVLTFNATPLGDIARVIEENYDLKIEIPDKMLAAERFTGAIPVDEDINVLLTMLSKSYQFEIKKTDDAIIFQTVRH
jgi:transmembrane sensor